MTSRGTAKSSKASEARTPVQWTGSPLDSCSSYTTTSNPSAARERAEARPPGPPPMMMTSRIQIVVARVAIGYRKSPRVPLRNRADDGFNADHRRPHEDIAIKSGGESGHPIDGELVHHALHRRLSHPLAQRRV